MSEQPTPVDAPRAGTNVDSTILGGVAILLGVVLRVISLGINTQIRVTGQGSERLSAVLSHPLWVPVQLAESAGLVLAVLGLAFLLPPLFRRGQETLVGAIVVGLGIVVILDLIEFTIAAVVGPSVSGGGALSSGLSPSEIATIIMGYQALGIGLILVTQVFIGLSFILIGAALYRADLFHRVFAGGAVLIGVLFVLNDITPIPLGPGGIILSGVALLWLLAIGTRMIRPGMSPT